MAQQLATLRTPAAYAGVEKYAHQHDGDASSAAYLALGHAYLLDKRYAQAEGNFRQAQQASDVLADYAEFLEAEADHEAGNENSAEALLHGFAGKYPDSIFVVEAPELEANVLLGMGNAAGAQQVLAQAAGTASAGRSGFQLAQGEVALAQGQTQVPALEEMGAPSELPTAGRLRMRARAANQRTRAVPGSAVR